MKKLFFLAIFICVAVFIGGCANQSTEHKEKIIVGINAYTPPMGFSDRNNQIIGFDVDLAKALAKHLNCDVHVRPLKAGCADDLSDKNIDILWNAINISSKEESGIIFTKPYMRDRQIVFVRAASPIENIEQLAGKPVGVRSGSLAQADIEKNSHLQRCFGSVIVYADTNEEFAALCEGKIAAVIDSEMIGRYYIKQHKGEIKALDITIGKPVALKLALRKEDTVLRDKVQAALDEMSQDGTLAQISQKWFGNDVTLY